MQKICYTSLKQTLFITLIGVLIVAFAIGIFVWILSIEPPFFDEESKVGFPQEIPKEKGFSYFNEADVCAAYLCQNPDFDGKNADLFFTSPEENEGYFIRVEVYTVDYLYDENGKKTGTKLGDLLGKSGFIRPGEYVETVHLKKKLKEQTFVALKVGVYEEATGRNRGSMLIPIYLTPPMD